MKKAYFLVDDATTSLGRFETMLLNVKTDEEAIYKAEGIISHLTEKELAKRDAVYIVFCPYFPDPDFPKLDNARIVKTIK